MQVPVSRHIVTFGPFELDLKAGELQRDGQTILLQEQPFLVLKILLEHSGDVVTREEIRRALWPNDTIVEFNQSINAAIKKLRLALDDSADNPKYVETVARRGYRLIVPVDGSEAAPVAAQEATLERAPLPLAQEPSTMRRFFLLFGATPHRRWEVMQIRLSLWCFLMAALGWRFMTWTPNRWGIVLFLLQIACTSVILILSSFLLYTGAIHPDLLSNEVRRTSLPIRYGIICLTLVSWGMAVSTLLRHPALTVLLVLCGTAGGLKYTLFKAPIDRAAFPQL